MITRVRHSNRGTEQEAEVGAPRMGRHGTIAVTR